MKPVSLGAILKMIKLFFVNIISQFDDTSSLYNTEHIYLLKMGYENIKMLNLNFFFFFAGKLNLNFSAPIQDSTVNSITPTKTQVKLIQSGAGLYERFTIWSSSPCQSHREYKCQHTRSYSIGPQCHDLLVEQRNGQMDCNVEQHNGN